MLNSIKSKIISYYKKASIQYIISISFTIVAVIGMIVVGGALYLRFNNSTEEMVLKNNKSILEQVNLNLDSYLRKMMKISDTIYYRAIKKTDLSDENIDKEMDLIYEANKDYLISISLFSDYGEVIASYPLQQLKNNIDPRESEWFQSAISKRENLHFSTPHVQNLFYDPNYKYTWVVSLSRAVEITESGRINGGVLLVDMNFSGIEQICKNVDMGKNGYVYLIDRDGEIIYHPRQQLIYSDLIKENNYEAAKYEDGNHVEKFEGDKRLVTVKTVGYTGWKIVAISPMTDITADYYEIRVFAIFMMFFAIFTLISINMFVSSRIANPIKELEKSVNEFENGVVNLNISESGSYEIQHLGKAIKSMVKQMNMLMENIMNEQEAKRKSELNALQAQINPHFLYNTLESIRMKAICNGDKEVGKMLYTLSFLFRKQVKDSNIITLKDELDYCSKYIEIFKFRYYDNFNFEINCPKDLEKYKIVKFSIQPLIENYFIHGIRFEDYDNELKIDVTKEENDIFIKIIDNGRGIPNEELEKINDKLLSDRQDSNSIGIENVNKRIINEYGEGYGLKILKNKDKGITLVVKILCKEV